MGYKKFLGMGYEKFLGKGVEIFTGFSCERFLGISADFRKIVTWEAFKQHGLDIGYTYNMKTKEKLPIKKQFSCNSKNGVMTIKILIKK